MKLRIQDMEVDNKKVLVRCDFNVPVIDGHIIDDSKIIASLETINYLIEKNAKIILLSHFGKVKSEEDMANNTLAPIAKYLSELLNKEINFVDELDKNKIYKMVEKMQSKDIFLLENTRFEDINNKLESNNDIQLSMFYASLADVFINDAFGSAHRSHASTVGVTKFLPSALGFLIQKELKTLDELLNSPERPFTIIMGGAKIDEKLTVIKTLIDKCDNLLLFGGIANTFLKALNFNVGFSMVNDGLIEKVKDLMINNKEKLFLPLDAVVGNNYDEKYVRYCLINDVHDDDVIYDIGPKTMEKYSQAINKSKVIFVNGTPGLYENIKFRNGSKEFYKTLAKSPAKVVIGGGDSVSAAKLLGYADKYDYLSTGGGATLEYLISQKLPAIEAIKEVEEK